MSDTKPTTHRVYLNEEEQALMRAICARTELGHTELLGKLVSAGLKAVAANGETFRLPLRASEARKRTA